MISRRPSPRRRRRGTVYVLVLATALIVVMAGLGGLAASRLRSRTTTLEQSWHEAGLLAQSAVEHALIAVESDPWWRETYAAREATWGPEIPVGEGTMSWRLDDPVDEHLNDDRSEPVRIYGRGTIGESRRAYSVLTWPQGPPLDILRCAIHAGGRLDVDGVLDARGGPVSTNADLQVAGDQVLGDAEASSVDAPENVSGSVTSPSPLKIMPSSGVWNAYKSLSTEIRFGDLGLSKTIQSVVISPARNPYRSDETNADGVYFVKVSSGNTLKLKNCRIVGTLLVELQGMSAKLTIAENVMMASSRPDFPTLIVYTRSDDATNVIFECSGTLDELMLGVNFNPPDTPYFGAFDTDTFDTYPASIRGLVHVLRDTATAFSSTTIDAPQQIYGAVVADGKVVTESGSIIVNDPALRSTPPLGYTSEPQAETLLVNGDVEEGLTGWSPLGGTTFLQVESDRHSGASAVRVMGRSTPAHGIAQDVTTGLTNGTTYTNDVWLKMRDEPEAVNVSLMIQSTSGAKAYTVDIPPVQKSWTRVNASFTPTWTGSLVSAVWSVSTATTTQEFNVDDAALSPQSTDPAPRLLPVPGTWRAEAAE